MSRTAIEEILKKAIQRGELHFEFADDDIDYLLAHTVPTKSGRPSKDVIAELERILLNAIAERERLEMAVKEKTAPYAGSTAVDGPDVGSCSVGDALHEELRTNEWTEKQAAEKLGISVRIIESLLKESMTVTRRTARRVSGLLGTQYRLSAAAEELLGQWLLNGLHFGKIRGKSGLMRTAARLHRDSGGRARKKRK
ncbi:MAG TPA: hypothetical protein VGR15_04695 [Bacteroidota bacterium]|nr:hypothetical protein [Bacteroidota bacterium]